MIDNLHITNVALIEDLDLSFHPGLNILSGETGAGKSIIIDSINFVLGSRPDKDFIRTGQELSQVSVIIRADQKNLIESVNSLGVDMGDDNSLLISRSYNIQGKSVCRINGRPATVGMVKEISSLLIDMHGQHEHQSLLDPAKHMFLLDKFCGDKLESLKNSLADNIKNYKSIVKEINALSGDGTTLAERKKMLIFQHEEIFSAGLSADEEDNLIEKRNLLINAQRLQKDSLLALELLSGVESDQFSASDMISKALFALQDLCELDPGRKQLAEELQSVSDQLSEIIRDLRTYSDGFDSSPDDLEDMEARLELIYNLKRKYGGSVEAVLEHLAEITDQLETIENSGQLLKKLNLEKKNLTGKILSLCSEISSTRKESAEIIKNKLMDVLSDLGMKNARFDISIERKKEFSFMGYDRVEFLISANPGELLKPLAKIASGGEMSRIMLALKTVLADVDNIETFVFDEIDTGVSGRTAQQVAEKLALISQNHQILCITHLPQIAAMADRHFLIEKKTTDDNKTNTEVFELDYENSVNELARLTGGAKITTATIKSAGEMKKMAGEIKAKRKTSGFAQTPRKDDVL